MQLIGSPALFVDGVQGVRVEGFTLRDSLLAARVERAGGLTLRHVVLEANLRSAVQVLDLGTRVTLEDVVVRDTQADPATQTFGQGIASSFGGQVTLTDVELSGNRETGLYLDRAQTAATVLTRCVLADATADQGMGAAVQQPSLLGSSSASSAATRAQACTPPPPPRPRWWPAR